jgi:serine/threonine protein kinase
VVPLRGEPGGRETSALEREPVLVFELAEGGSLRGRLERRGALTPDHTERCLSQLSSGLALLSQHGIVHGDLSPRNLLLDRDGELLIADFGLSLATKGRTTGFKWIAGPHYNSPQAYERGASAAHERRHDEEVADGKGDTWAMGLLTLDMLFGLDGAENADRRYGKGKDQGAIWKQIDDDFNALKELPRSAGHDATLDRLKGLVRRMLVVEVRERATPGEIAEALSMARTLERSVPQGGVDEVD